MDTARLETVGASIATRCEHGGGREGSEVKKYEQVSSLGH